MVILVAAARGSQFASTPKRHNEHRVPIITEDTCRMITITLMGQLQTTDGERDLACELPTPVTVRQVIQRQGRGLRHMLQLLREKKVLVTINKRIASEDSLVQDGDAVRFVGHDGAGGSGLAPSF